MFNRFVFGGPPLQSKFETTYRCYSASMFSGQDKVRREAETGGKIIMPQSALESLVQLNIQYPMIFRLANRKNVSLPKATYAKFQPQNVNFLDISNPKAVLENELRKFACLSTGDIIVLHYNNREYELLVQELKPMNSVTIIECDVNVEFDKPVGYEESTVPKSASQASLPGGFSGTDGGGLSSADMDDLSHQPVIPEGARNADRPIAFPGAGQRLDGKAKLSSSAQKSAVFCTDGPTASSSAGNCLPSVESSSSLNGSAQQIQQQRGVPNYDYRPGELHFIRQFNRGGNSTTTDGGDAATSFKAFDGAGCRLKTARTNKAR